MYNIRKLCKIKPPQNIRKKLDGIIYGNLSLIITELKENKTNFFELLQAV